MQADLAPKYMSASATPSATKSCPIRSPGLAQQQVEPDAGEGEREQRVVQVAHMEVQRRAVGDQPEHEQAQAADDDLARARARVVVPRLVSGERRAHLRMLARPRVSTYQG